MYSLHPFGKKKNQLNLYKVIMHFRKIWHISAFQLIAIFAIKNIMPVEPCCYIAIKICTNSNMYHSKIPYNYYLIPILIFTDYGRPERKQPSLHGRKFNPNPKFLGTAKAYFVCHIGPIFQISLPYAFIGCPQSVFLKNETAVK